MASLSEEQLLELRAQVRTVINAHPVDDPDFIAMVHEGRNSLIAALDGAVDWRSSGIGALWASQNAFGLAHALMENGRTDAAEAMAAYAASVGMIAEALFTQGELPELVTTDIAED